MASTTFMKSTLRAPSLAHVACNTANHRPQRSPTATVTCFATLAAFSSHHKLCRKREGPSLSHELLLPNGKNLSVDGCTPRPPCALSTSPSIVGPSHVSALAEKHELRTEKPTSRDIVTSGNFRKKERSIPQVEFFFFARRKDHM